MELILHSLETLPQNIEKDREKHLLLTSSFYTLTHAYTPDYMHGHTYIDHTKPTQNNKMESN